MKQVETPKNGVLIGMGTFNMCGMDELESIVLATTHIRTVHAEGVIKDNVPAPDPQTENM